MNVAEWERFPINSLAGFRNFLTEVDEVGLGAVLEVANRFCARGIPRSHRFAGTPFNCPSERGRESGYAGRVLVRSSAGLRLGFNHDVAPALDLDVQVVLVEQEHPYERCATGGVGFDRIRLAVP